MNENEESIDKYVSTINNLEKYDIQQQKEMNKKVDSERIILNTSKTNIDSNKDIISNNDSKIERNVSKLSIAENDV